MVDENTEEGLLVEFQRASYSLLNICECERLTCNSVYHDEIKYRKVFLGKYNHLMELLSQTDLVEEIQITKLALTEKDEYLSDGSIPLETESKMPKQRECDVGLKQDGTDPLFRKGFVLQKKIPNVINPAFDQLLNLSCDAKSLFKELIYHAEGKMMFNHIDTSDKVKYFYNIVDFLESIIKQLKKDCQ